MSPVVSNIFILRRSEGGFSLLLQGGERCCQIGLALTSLGIFFSIHRRANTGLNHVIRVSNHMQNKNKNGLFDITGAFVHSPTDELIVLVPPAWVIQPGQGLLMRRALYGTRTASRPLGKNLLKGFEQRWVDSEQSASRDTVPRWPCGHDHMSR